MPHIDHKDMKHVFVYGTLRKAWGNHAILKGAYRGVAHEVGVAHSVAEDFAMAHFGVPYLIADVPTDGSVPHGKVEGEVYLIDPDMLEVLDRLEGYVEGRRDNHYNRIEVDVVMVGEYLGMTHGCQIKAFVYVAGRGKNVKELPPEHFVKPNKDGLLVYPGYTLRQPDTEGFDDPEFDEAEDQSLGDVLGLHDERELP
jgi:gamma-glutamylcyclotransferase (GGCT)/AIG2-like uncharacterized protein YtfP